MRNNAMRENEPVVLRVKNLVKAFPGVLANDNVSLEVKRGEIHCLLGENGAGKSTLAGCLYGVHKPDSGSIWFKGNTVALSSPRDAIDLGIGMVHQHFELIPPMNVLENIVVGSSLKGFFLNFGKAIIKIQTICANYDVKLDLDSTVSQLPVGKQQWVEITKALYVDSTLLILDEPTAVLTPQEVTKLFNLLKRMTKEGLSIILITHKLNEVMEISDRISVMRKGKLIETVNTAQTTEKELARMMVGRDVIFRVKKEKIDPGEPVLELSDVCAFNDKGEMALNGANLTIRRREIIGLAGVAGNGQKELFDVIAGVRKILSGRMTLDGKDISKTSTRSKMKMGIACIPEDRIKEGLLMESPISKSMILGSQGDRQFNWGPLLDSGAIRKFACAAIQKFEIKTPGPNQKTKSLSGGNLQKVILARETSHSPNFLVTHQPTRGLDVGAIEYVQHRLIELKEAGAGILLISEELEEIYSLSDYIAVIFRGRILDVLKVEDATIEKVGLLMGGIQDGR
jgi:general nucleoside transport system ATP-binding protein